VYSPATLCPNCNAIGALLSELCDFEQTTHKRTVTFIYIYRYRYNRVSPEDGPKGLKHVVKKEKTNINKFSVAIVGIYVKDIRVHNAIGCTPRG
jgi:hypothetical protein